jgi:hypothetical protein
MSLSTPPHSTGRLDEIERCLGIVTSEKTHLLEALGETQQINHHTSFEIKELRSGSSEGSDWSAEKKSMERRLMESDRALVLLAKENEELQNTIGKIMEENKMIKANKGGSGAEDATGENKEEKLTSELSALKLSFYKEKKKMMARQQELEGLLIEALKERFGGETNEVILKKLGEAQLEITGGAKKKNVAAE